MKKYHISKLLMILAVITILTIGVNAAADPGPGYGRGMGYGPGMNYGYKMGPGMGYGPGMNYGPGMGYRDHRGRGFRGYGYAADLSEEDLKKLDEQRKTFFEETDDLRRGMYSKRLELRSEIAKKNPDTQKAAEIQKEISRLRTELTQKRTEHLIKVKKINPNVGMGFSGRGPGRFGGPCWR